MKITRNKIENHSLKESCLAVVEAMILSGELLAGQKLPAERDFATRLGVSRPVLHEALVELSLKGLVTISPRHGVSVDDFRQKGSMLLLDSLLSYPTFTVSKQAWSNLFDFRKLIEGETAWQAAQNRTDYHLTELQVLLHNEQTVDTSNPEKLTELDFSFHLAVAQASTNIIYPLIINTFKQAYTSYTRTFFNNNRSSVVISAVFEFHTRLVQAITDAASEPARQIMIDMLVHGEKYLKG